MSAAQRRINEERRLQAIAALDMEASRPTFDRLTALARTLAAVRGAHVDFVGAKVLSVAGVSSQPTSPVAREESFAVHVIAGDEVLWVEDLAKDPRFRTNPYVTGPAQCRFYAGAPIRLTDGSRIGALSIIDSRPRAYDGFLAERLEDLAALAAEECERRRAVSEAARASAEAKVLTEQFAAMLEAAPVALVITDRELRILRVSPRWRRDMAMDREEVVGRRLYELFPNSEAQLGDAFARALAGEVVRHDRLQLDPREGLTLCVQAEVTAWRDPSGLIGGLLIMSHDVTDMVESLDRAERSEQRFRLAAEMAQLSVYELDVRGENLRTEGADLGPLGRDFKYETLDKVWMGVHPADREQAKALWDAHEQHGGLYSSVHRLLQEDGRHPWVSVVAEAKKDRAGRLERVVGVIRNVDQEKQAEAAMTTALDAAEAAKRAKSEFLANMSHEIRTPLNGVTGVAGILKRTALTPEQREMVEVIDASARTLDTLLNDVLELARIETGRLELIAEPFDLASILREAADQFAPRVLQKGLKFKSTISPAAHTWVIGDAARVRQILANLLSNAVKFTHQGRVSLNVEAEPLEDDIRLRVSVIDTGIGFDSDTAKRIFNRFEQADGSSTRRFGGTGLGLAISRSLAEAMGGSLHATGVPGKGAVFSFEALLPAAAPALADDRSVVSVDAAPEPPEAISQPRPPRVLLAEDHPTNRKVVSLILDSMGVDYLCVENGRDAVAAVEAGPFELVLMDMQMPVMDGLTAIRKIRARERRAGAARTAIFSLTANAMPEHARASAEAGADGHLTKPISAGDLVKAVTQAFSRADVNDTLSEAC